MPPPSRARLRGGLGERAGGSASGPAAAAAGNSTAACAALQLLQPTQAQAAPQTAPARRHEQ
jgi:acyl-coenzyme A thioesterase PaaI-like protein